MNDEKDSDGRQRADEIARRIGIWGFLIMLLIVGVIIGVIWHGLATSTDL